MGANGLRYYSVMKRNEIWMALMAGIVIDIISKNNCLFSLLSDKWQVSIGLDKNRLKLPNFPGFFPWEIKLTKY